MDPDTSARGDSISADGTLPLEAETQPGVDPAPVLDSIELRAQLGEALGMGRERGVETRRQRAMIAAALFEEPLGPNEDPPIESATPEGFAGGRYQPVRVLGMGGQELVYEHAPRRAPATRSVSWRAGRLGSLLRVCPSSRALWNCDGTAAPGSFEKSLSWFTSRYALASSQKLRRARRLTSFHVG